MYAATGTDVRLLFIQTQFKQNLMKFHLYAYFNVFINYLISYSDQQNEWNFNWSMTDNMFSVLCAP